MSFTVIGFSNSSEHPCSIRFFSSLLSVVVGLYCCIRCHRSASRQLRRWGFRYWSSEKPKEKERARERERERARERASERERERERKGEGKRRWKWMSVNGMKARSPFNVRTSIFTNVHHLRRLAFNSSIVSIFQLRGGIDIINCKLEILIHSFNVWS